MLLLNLLGVDVLGDRKRRRASWDMGFKGDYMDFQNNKPLQNVISKAYVYVIQTIHKIIKLSTTKPQFFHDRFNESRGRGWGNETFGRERFHPLSADVQKNKNKLHGELSEVSPSREEWIESKRYRDNVHLPIAFINDQSFSSKFLVSSPVQTMNIIDDASLITYSS